MAMKVSFNDICILPQFFFRSKEKEERQGGKVKKDLHKEKEEGSQPVVVPGRGNGPPPLTGTEFLPPQLSSTPSVAGLTLQLRLLHSHPSRSRVSRKEQVSECRHSPQKP